MYCVSTLPPTPNTRPPQAMSMFALKIRWPWKRSLFRSWSQSSNSNTPHETNSWLPMVMLYYFFSFSRQTTYNHLVNTTTLTCCARVQHHATFGQWNFKSKHFFNMSHVCSWQHTSWRSVSKTADMSWTSCLYENTD